jgi:head-tail adaptor
VDFSFPRDDVLEVTVWAGAEKLFNRTLTAAEEEVACDAGRLIVRNRRWVRADVMLAHERATLNLHRAGDYLVAQVEDKMAGLFFVILPIMGTTTHWYRFSRLQP